MLHLPSVFETDLPIQKDDTKIFTTFDPSKDYHPIELHGNGKLLTTYIIKFARLYCNRASFGINSISEHYNCRMFVLIVPDGIVTS